MIKLNRIAASEHKHRSLLTNENQIGRACRAAATEKIFAVLSDEYQSISTVFKAVEIFDKYYAQADVLPDDPMNDAYLTMFLALKLVIAKSNQNSEDSEKTLESGLKELFDSNLIAEREIILVD